MAPAGTAYQHLFTPCFIGTLRVKNRIAMAPIDSIYRTVEGDLNERHRYYLGARAAGGAGLIFTDNFVVEYPRGAVGSKAARLDQDRFVASLNETVEEVHAWDALVFGRSAMPGGRRLWVGHRRSNWYPRPRSRGKGRGRFRAS